MDSGQRQLRPRHKRLSYTIPIHEDESDSSVGSSSTSYHARSSTWRPNVVTRRALKERHSLENFAGTARRQSSEKLSQIAVVIDNSRYHVAGQHGSENILTTPSKAGCSSGLLNADKRETLELRYTENGSPLVQETDQESNSDEEDVDDDVLSRPFVPRRQSLRKRMPVVTPIGSAASGTESTYALRCRGRTRHSSSESRRSSIAIPPTPGNNSSDDELSYL
ncbi:hypothetical protein KEM55_004637 [Ascosphaera atra]|nr:hypothetical protein KEM55_004637 [Ascosphaera atra]